MKREKTLEKQVACYGADSLLPDWEPPAGARQSKPFAAYYTVPARAGSLQLHHEYDAGGAHRLRCGERIGPVVGYGALAFLGVRAALFCGASDHYPDLPEVFRIETLASRGRTDGSAR
jgi:hypothetical protein